jgi:hypothetical protein
MTYTGTLSGNLPTLGTVPAGYNFAFDTNTVGLVNLVVSPNTPPPAPLNLTAVATNGMVNLSWSSAATATSYNVKRSTVSGGPYPTIAPGITTTNYSDTQVTNFTTYYYVVSALNAAGEGANSSEVSATPVASTSLVPTNIVFQLVGNQLNLSWPTDHLGWRLQYDTNLNDTNWITVPNSTNVISTNFTIDPTTGGLFFRMIYP